MAQCAENGVVPQDSYWSMTDPGIGLQLCFLAGGGVVYFALVLLIEADILPSFKGKVRALDAAKDDADVRDERARIARGGGKKDAIVVEGLTKVFKGRKGRRNYHAVDHLSFGIPAGECFGYGWCTWREDGGLTPWFPWMDG